MAHAERRVQDELSHADALIGGVEGVGFKTAMKVLDKGRLNIATACVGLAERLIERREDVGEADRARRTEQAEAAAVAAAALHELRQHELAHQFRKGL